MASVYLKGDRLEVKIGPWEAVMALQGSFSVPLANVRGATEDSNYINSGIGFRSPGTEVPGLVVKGTYRKKGQKALTIWRRGQQLVVIELQNEKWDRLLLGCQDAKSLANLVNQAIAR
ncbi:MAG: hypothetical protein ACK5CU_04375 [Rhodoluna sp.]|jgi:hypothetical protein